MKDNQIPGEIFSPVFMSEEEFENGYKNSIFYVEKDYYKEYSKHIAAMQHIANVAKSYILKNWKKVTDWSGLNVTLIHGSTGKETEYFNYVPHKPSQKGSSKTWDKIMSSIDESDKLRHNPITEFNEVILDPTDGDFSITVNKDQEHWWIQDEAVIIIADYIENFLKNEYEKNNS